MIYFQKIKYVNLFKMDLLDKFSKNELKHIINQDIKDSYVQYCKKNKLKNEILKLEVEFKISRNLNKYTEEIYNKLVNKYNENKNTYDKLMHKYNKIIDFLLEVDDEKRDLLLKIEEINNKNNFNKVIYEIKNKIETFDKNEEKQINKEMIEIIKNKYDCHIIEENGEYLFNVSDIGKILDLKCIHQALSSINLNEKKKIYRKTKGGDQNMVYITYNGLCKVILKSRKPNIIKISSDFGINTTLQKNICIEAEIIYNIKLAFKNEETKDQYYVDGFKIDLYFEVYKLAIECDENQHNIEINKIKDIQREKYIKEKLGCEFIRFKPYDKEFNIFKLINDIYSFIKEK